MKLGWFRLVTMLLCVAVLVGCASPAPTAAPTVAPAAAAPTAAPAKVEPTAVPPTAVPPTAVPPTAVSPTVAPTAAAPKVEAGPNDLILATTTSTQDSGLLDYLLPAFEKECGCKVAVIAVGTGQAIKLGEDGNADVLMVHARAQEDAYMAAGHGTRREDVMYNDFVVVGPKADPAGIKGMKDAVKGMTKLAEAKATFISRGDKSGTNTKELSVWKAAGIEPKGDWYIAAGQGMGEVLTMAAEQQAYTLSDRATYLAMTLKGLDLEIMLEGDKVLLNPYGVITVNPNKGAHIKAELANKFVDWIISVPAQELIGQYGVKEFGKPLFTPDSAPWKAKAGAGAGAAAPTGSAALKVGDKSFTMDDLKAMEVVKVKSTNSKGAEEEYEGVKITDVLKAANATGTSIVLVADDGYTAEVAVADLTDECILSFRSNGGLSSVMPGLAKNTNVKGVVEIQVK